MAAQLAGAAAAQIAPLRLVLLVGPSLQPDSTLREVIAREGLRGLWLADLHQAAQALRSARIDALVVELAALLRPGAPALSPLTSTPPCPVIAVGPLASEVDELLALSCGATAFLPWPFSPERLLAQLQALIRITQARGAAMDAAPQSPPAARSGSGGWQVDRLRNQLWRSDRQIALTNAQSAMLHTLLAAHERVVSRGQLAAALPGGHALSERAIDVYLHRLRQRLKQASVADLCIKTVAGRGYCIVAGEPSVATVAARTGHSPALPAIGLK